MAISKFLITNGIVDKNIYGGKAFWLSWLIEEGFNTPPCIFIPAIDEGDLDELKDILRNDIDFNKQLKKFEIRKNHFDVAIRSSAILEDSSGESYAGHFKSFIETISYDQIFKNIEGVVKSVKIADIGNPQKIGVIVQKKINARFSGVIFSSNPLTASKTELVISVIEGMGEQLLSGKTVGEDIFVRHFNGKSDLPKFKSKIDENIILELCDIAKNIEGKLDLPVDIEWCVDRKSNKLSILQCRPITSIIPKHFGIIPINLKNEDIFPDQVRINDKVKIRLLAQKNNIDISSAYLAVNINSSMFDEIEFYRIRPEERCKGFSVVLIFPRTISGNTIRHFTEKEMSRQNNIYRTCQRYIVRTYPDYENIKSILHSIQDKCCDGSWLCIAIIQELFEPLYTGIAKKIKDGFLIELAKGHFIPKGVVQTSQYIVNDKHELLFKNEIIQENAYEIFQGVVSKKYINSLISINDNTIGEIVDKLLPVLSAGAQAVEFGLLEDKSIGSLTPYLIDMIDDNSPTELSSKLIAEGVISAGIRRGKANILDTKNLSYDSLEIHFHDRFENQNTIDEEIIFVTETPDIALLEILKHFNNEKIGFIFKAGSVLSHFSIILRERKIPAIVINQEIYVQELDYITIDATSPNLKGVDRLSN